MARFGELAISGLTVGTHNGERVFRYTSPTLNFYFQFERETTIITDWYWTDLYIKATIYGEGDTILSEDIEWKELGSNYNYKGDTARGFFSRTISTFVPIKKIIIKGRRKNDTKENNIVSKTYTLETNQIYKSISFNNNDNLVFSSYSINKGQLRPSNTISVYNIPVVQGTNKEKTYLNNYYHNGFLKINTETVYYLGAYRTPTQIFLRYADTSIKLNIGEQIIKVGEQIINNLRIVYSIGDAIWEKNFEDILPLSAFSATELNLSNLSIRANYIIDSKQTNDGYEIEQGSLFSGTLTFLHKSEELPYDFTTEECVYTINDISQEYFLFSNETNTIIFNSLYPFGTYKMEAVQNATKWNNNGAIFFEKDESYYIYLQCRNKFTQQKDRIIVPLKTATFQWEEQPIFFDRAYNREIKYKEQVLDTNILNPYETLKLKINSEYIYFPSYRKITDENINFSFSLIGAISDRQNFISVNRKELINECSYNELTNLYNLQRHSENEQSIAYTHFLQIGIQAILSNQNTNEIASGLEWFDNIRLGRVVPMKISSCKIMNDQLSYLLEEYGGDKTEQLGSNPFIPNNSSLSRSGKNICI